MFQSLITARMVSEQGEYSGGIFRAPDCTRCGKGRRREGKGGTGVGGKVWVRGNSKMSLETPLGWSLAALAALQFSGCRNALQS